MYLQTIPANILTAAVRGDVDLNELARLHLRFQHESWGPAITSYSTSKRFIHRFGAVFVYHLASLASRVYTPLLSHLAGLFRVFGTGQTSAGQSVLAAGNYPCDTLVSIRKNHLAISRPPPAAIRQGRLLGTLLAGPANRNACICGCSR